MRPEINHLSRMRHDLVCAGRAAVTLSLALLAIAPSWSQQPTLPGTQFIRTKHSFDVLVERVEKAVARHDMGLVARASASRGAAARGVRIRGNAVLMVFRNDYAVRMLEASVPAGIEAPLRIYVTENADGTANLTYRAPSALFAPYGSLPLDELARELDVIFENIARDAAGE
ncbi:MAG: DUF302 domain-containing protein [Betaproteobacteria bacterium]